MADRKYAVAFDGELIEGVTAVDMRGRLARIWPSLSAPEIETLMGSRNATLKLFADRDVADRFVGFMRQAGMVCWLRLLRPEEEAPPVVAELGWSVEESAALLAAATAAPPAPPRRIHAPKVSMGPKATTAVISLLACAAIAYWAIGPAPKKRRVLEPSVATAPAPDEATSEATAPAPVAELPQSKTLMVPEPVFVSARAERAALKESPPATAEAAKLEGAAPPKPMPATAPPVVFAPATAPPQTIAMNAPSAATKAAPVSAAAEVITAPSYDRAKVSQPRYPVQAYRNHEQGEVLLNVVVGTDGKPKTISIDRTSGSNALDRAAIEAVKGWQFTPGTRNGVAREAARQVAVGFKLDE